MISINQLNQLFQKASPVTIQAFADQAENVFTTFGLNANTNRLYFFLAQIGHESGGLTISEENLNYSAERLLAVWPARFPDLSSAQPYARNPEKLANFVYANRMGNGPPESGDGYRFRGRGYIQITGKEAYQALGKAAEIDLVNQPDLAHDVNSALRVACGFWKWKNLNPICDAGNFEKLTRRINGGINGLDDRKKWLTKVQTVLGGAAAPVDFTTKASIQAAQQALANQGYAEVGRPDGLMGPNTRKAITRFRQEKGLPPGNAIDQTLWDALKP